MFEVRYDPAVNSNQTSMSSESCSSFSCLSFDVAIDLATIRSSPERMRLKPHRSSDLAYSAIRLRKMKPTFRDFQLVRRIGSGDIGTVYLCRLWNSSIGDEDDPCLYAMKVVDKEALALKNKVQRAEMERKILKTLDHPFLPLLYAEFDASRFSCVVMEFCSGGDLHSLMHKQPLKCFSLYSARFYAAEVLMALEYLHMLGIIYRDLKPENVLIKSDGHIMLSDFDLSLCSDAIPAVETPDSTPDPAPEPTFCTRSQRIISSIPTAFPCLRNRLSLSGSRKVQTLAPNRLFVAEPTTARSCSFVGTHEYVSPEVASGGSHGNAVDWWAFGIFVYEMIYGRTPFAARSNEMTLTNIIKEPLTFPTPVPKSGLELQARDLISALLNKDPDSRLGSKRGSSDVKKHPFFKGLNFALLRSLKPPEIPRLKRKKRTSSLTTKTNAESMAFDYF